MTKYLRQLRSHASNLTKDQLSTLNAAVVIIGSTAGKFGEANHADYSSTKSALMYKIIHKKSHPMCFILGMGLQDH